MTGVSASNRIRVRRPFEAVAVVLASCVLAGSVVTPAGATPGPQREEWWFDSLAIPNIAWPLTKGSGVTVGLIDSGVNADLPDFQGSVVLPGADFSGTGTDGTTDTDNESGHGTGMASLIAAQGTGPSGWVGIAPEAKILSVVNQVTSPDAEARSIRYAVDHGAKVVNMSHTILAAGFPDNCPPAVLDASAYAAKHDAILVASAGNTGNAGNSPAFPAACPGVLAVGAYDHSGDPWQSTQRQSYVSIAGPGAGVGYIGRDGRLYHYGNGTSQAAALVSGAVALIRSRFPNESARQVVQRILATVTDLGPPGWDEQMGYGALSLRKALTQTVPASASNPVYDRLDKALAAQGKDPDANTATPAASSRKGSSGVWKGLAVVAALLFVILVILIAVAASRRRPPSPSTLGPSDRPSLPSDPPPYPYAGYVAQEAPFPYGSHQDRPG